MRWGKLLVLTNLVSLGLLLALADRYNVGSKIYNRLFVDGRVPLVTEDYANNRFFAERIALYEARLPREEEWILLGDSHMAIPQWSQLLGAGGIVSFGVEGDTVRGLTYRLTRLGDKAAPRAVILIGTNDILRDSTAERIREDMEALLEEARPRFSRIILVEIPPLAPWVERAGQRNAVIDELNAYLRGLGEPPVQLLPLNQLMRSAPDWPRRTLMNDGVHLSADGYALFAQHLERALALSP